MTSTDKKNDDLLQCYNKGCGLKYTGNENNEGVCCFHPGAPIFHDAYKGWSCCNKKSTDFTTFLHTKGCTEGKHNPVKPEEPMKQKPDESSKNEVITVTPPKLEFMQRPDISTNLERLKMVISPSLKDALGKENEKTNEVEEDTIGIKIGEPCKNNGCKTTYEGEHTNLNLCKYHPGVPVFHEGLKFWYCCQRRTTDFELFLQQEGCSTGSHLWTKKNLKKTTCRYDWHQTSTYVYVTVYAKLSSPNSSFIDVNPVRLNARIEFLQNQEFVIDNELGGIIVPSESLVTMAETKVEIKMRKAEPKTWNKLFLPPIEDNKKEDSKKDESIDESLCVDAIDLNDI